jgi:serine/threonine protein kinase/osmotically-inducible protein OsmY
MKDPRYPYALDIDSEVAGYRILSILGAGGFGITYKGFNDVTHKMVAIKEFYVRDISSRTGSTVVVDTAVSEGTYEYALQKFQDEAKTVVNRFSHQYVIRGENFIKQNNTCYLIMEYVEGVNLEQWVSARATPPSEAELRSFMMKVFDAVDYVHEQNTMHRDITPRNIMIRPNGDPVLIDFGAAGQGIDRDRSSKMVAQMRYAPPEQTDSEGPGQHGRYTDIYSIGAVLYRCVTGAPPLASITRIVRMGRRGGGAPDPYVPAAEAATRPDLYTPRFLAGIDHALELDEAERPQSIAELVASLGWDTPAEDALPPPIGIAPDEMSRTVSLNHSPDSTSMVARKQPSDVRRPSRGIDVGRPSERISVVSTPSGTKVRVADTPAAAAPAPAPAPAAPTPRRSWIGIAAAAAVVLLAGGGGAAWYFAGGLTEPVPAGAYGFTANRDGSSVKLAGFVPVENTRIEIEAEIAKAVPGARIAGALRPRDGAPPGYSDFARFALGGLGRLSTGTVKIEGQTIAISGKAASPEAYQALRRDYARTLPGGWTATLAVDPATIASYTFAAGLTGGRVTLTGHVPDEASRTRITDAVKAVLPGAPVEDALLIADGAPAEFAELATFGLGRLADLADGRVALTDREVKIQGRARSHDAYQALSTLSNPVAGGTMLVAVRPPQVSPYEWAVSLDRNQAVLSGYVPSPEARTEIAAAAARLMRGISIRDDSRIADGAPENFLAAARFAVDQAQRLARGRVALADTGLAIDGQAAGPAEFSQLNAALGPGGGLPAGFTVKRNSLGAPRISPYPWAASTAGGVVRLTGFAPSDQARQEILAAARAALPGASVDDQTELGDGAPDSFVNAVKQALAIVPRLATGRVALEDGRLAVSGTATNPETHAALLRDLARLTNGAANLSGLQAPSVAPYVWSAELAAGRVRMSGYVPGEDARAAVAEAQRRNLPGIVPQDTTLVATGAPRGFAEATALAFTRLFDLSEGKATLTDGDLRVEGRAKSFDAYQQALARDQDPPPAGLRVTTDIRPPIAKPFEITISTDDRTVAVTGYLPGRAAKTELQQATAAGLRGRAYRDDTRVADGAPADIGVATRFLAEQALRLARGRASLSDRAIGIEGQAATPQDYEDLRRATAALPSGYTAGRIAVDPARVSPYSFAAMVQPGAVRLTGHVPSDAVRRDLVQAAGAAFQGFAVDDQTRIADGAPDAFAARARFALQLAARLGSGRAALEDADMLIEGTAASPDAHAALGRDAARPPQGIAAPRLTVLPAAVAGYWFTAEMQGGRVKLSGYAPAEDLRVRLADAARRAAPGATLTDETRPAAGAPTGFADAAAFAVDRIGDLSEGKASIADGVVTIEGRARSSDAYQAFAALPAPQGMRLAVNVRPPLAQPFEWSVSLDHQSATLAGVVPTADLKRETAARLAQLFPDRAVRDETKIADGAPADFTTVMRLALDQLPRFERGRVGVSDRALTIDGQSTGVDATEALRRAFAPTALPAGFRLARYSVNSPVVSPYTWSVALTGGDVRLAGFLPSESARRDLVAAAQQVPGWRVADQLQVGEGAPDRFLETVRIAMIQSARLASGSIRIEDTTIAIEGVAASPEAYAGLVKDFAQPLPGGFQARVDVRPAAVSPYVWSARVERGGAVRIAGFVPSDDDRKRILDGLRAVLPRGADLRDETRIAAGATPGFADTAISAGRRIGDLADGSAISLSDRVLKVTGQARSQQSYETLKVALADPAVINGNFRVDFSVDPPIVADPKPEAPPEVKPETRPEVRPETRPRPPEADARPRPERQPAAVRPDRTPDRTPDAPARPARPPRTEPVVTRPDPTPPRPPREVITVRPVRPVAPPTAIPPRPSIESNCAASRC